MNLLVTSRERPSWATARRLLYGEVYEITRAALAFTPEEAAQLVDTTKRGDLPGLLALAEGWPAAIGLAALASDAPVALDAPLPEALYNFFAEELFQVADSRTQHALCELSLLPRLTAAETEDLLGPESETALAHGERIGFVTRERDETIELHPLLRSFLREKVEADKNALQAALRRTVPFLVSRQSWDAAYQLVDEYELHDLFPQLIEAGVAPLLDDGRIATIERWARTARRLDIREPVVDLLESELLFRSGDWLEAERLAGRAATTYPSDSPIVSRAYFRAGQSAHLADSHERALDHHRRARDTARNRTDLSQAFWGMFLSQCELEQTSEAAETLARFDVLQTGRAEDELRLLGGRITLACRTGGLKEVVRSVDSVQHLTARPCDPVVKCGFYQTLGNGLNLVAQYKEALRATEREIQEAKANFLSFALPHAHANRAVAHLGLRNMKTCEAALLAAEAADRDTGVHTEMNVRAIRARMYLAQGRVGEAEVVTRPLPTACEPSQGMHGDFLGTRALALACAGNPKDALVTIDRALEVSRQVETRVLCAAARAVVAISGQREVDYQISALVQEVRSTGNNDSLICAYRACPELLRTLARSEFESELIDLVCGAGDRRLARRIGLNVGGSPAGQILSVRELEVLELLRRGMTNKQIAKTLWISEATAKVHVRTILRKLNVRSRTEAALAAERNHTIATAGGESDLLPATELSPATDF